MALKEKVALVTGASKGIGRAAVLEFARNGCNVVACARNVTLVNEVMEEARSLGVEAHAVQADVRRDRDVRRFVGESLKRFDRVDVLVNNAGLGVWGTVEQISEEDFNAMVDTNFRGVYLCTKAVLPVMIKQHSGVIISVSSVAGKRPIANLAVYCGTKYALDGFSFSLAKEVKEHNIRVGVVYPGMVDTHFREAMAGRRKYTPNEKSTMLSAADVARAVVFMADQEQTSSVDTLEISAPLFTAGRQSTSGS